MIVGLTWFLCGQARWMSERWLYAEGRPWMVHGSTLHGYLLDATRVAILLARSTRSVGSVWLVPWGSGLRCLVQCLWFAVAPLCSKGYKGSRRVMLWLACEWGTSERQHRTSTRLFSVTVNCAVLSTRLCCLCCFWLSFPCKLAHSVWFSIRFPL